MVVLASTKLHGQFLLQDLSDYSRVNPLTVTPPWCLTLRLSGHSFNKDFGTVLPEYVYNYYIMLHT